jgi:outer membrane receptor protein involved in Fe transport
MFNRLGQLGRLALLVALSLLLPLGLMAQSDNGKLEGVIVDEAGEPVMFANVIVLRGTGQVAATATNQNGEFSFQSISAGTYDLKITYAGKEKLLRKIQVNGGRVVRLPAITFETSTTLGEVELIYVKPPVDAENPGISTIGGEEFKRIATRDVNTAVSTASGVFSSDDGKSLNIRGARDGGTQVFVDGERVIGSQALTQQAIEQVDLLKSGIPAEFGDATGGVVSVTTTPSASDHHFGIEGVTSQFLDNYGYNLIGLTATGPIFKDRDPVNPKLRGQSRAGYFISAELQFDRDREPPNVDLKRLRPGLLDSLNENPLRPRAGGRFFDNSASFLRNSDFRNTNVKANNGAFAVRVNGRLDFRVGRDSWLRFGGSYEMNDQRIFNNSRYLFSPQGHERREDNTIRVYARFSQLFTDTAAKAILKSLSYQVQVSYTRFQQTRSQGDFGDQFFKYGHVGRFTPSQIETYEYISPEDPRHKAKFSANGYWQTSGFRDTSYRFDPSNSSNPIQANYNEAILRELQKNPRINPNSFPTAYSGGFFDYQDVRQLGGIVNGDNTTGNSALSVYSLFEGMGAIFNGYSKRQDELIRLTGQATLQLGKSHNLKFGFEFDQRFERFFSISPAGLWTIMNQQANRHLSQLDTANPLAVRDPSTGIFLDTVRLRPVIGSDQSVFDRNMRIKLGLNPNGTDFIRPEQYDPSFFNLGMFSANELFNAGKPIVTYYGYNYTGGITGQRPSGDFFSDLNTRPQNAFAPTYFAGYIQDKFELDRIILSVGFRFDRLDLNQKVLRDKFVMRPTYTAGEVNQTLFPELPSVNGNIGSGWIPYVNSRTNPTDIVGYRSGSNWYDKFGAPVSPRLLEVNGRVIPLLKSDSLTIDAFKDYAPQFNFMPRVALSFPITSTSTFFASYDVLTQRPSTAQVSQFIDYLFIQQNATDAINNPNLRPEKTINYEVGFQQAISPKIGITISAFFREMRDMIQIVRNTNAYPITYDSYENVDYGTVKGFSAELQTLRLGILQIRAAYTLQFATGTGSSFSSSRNALNGVDGFSLIRNELALTFDQRHTITGTLDVRWDDQRNKGPVIRTKNGREIYLLKNFGINLTYTLGSGTPFSYNALPNPADVQFGVNSVIQTKGQPLSNSLPWRLRLNLRIDKDFDIFLNKKAVEQGRSEGGSVRPRYMHLNIYLLVLNLLDNQNILNVYRYSGQANTSGYLDSPQATTFIQQQISPQSFVDLYRIKEINPAFYSVPRRIRLGFNLTF